MTAADPRAYPDRPFVAVSAAIIREHRILLVRRAQPPNNPVHTLPGGVVEAGETLLEAVQREVQEETGLAIEPLALAGHREFIARDDDRRVFRHFIILCFAARWVAGEPVVNEELAEAKWVRQEEVSRYKTTEGLGEIVDAAFAQIAAVSGGA